jgi:hypothetical protein
MSDIIAHFSAPQWGPNSTTQASMPHQLHRSTPAKLWQAMSLLLCKRWQGLRLSACQPCAMTRLWPLFSVRPAVPILAECSNNTMQQKHCRTRWWRKRFRRRQLLPDAFRHHVLADEWGQALALECLQRFSEGSTEEEDADIQGSRRKCLIQSREVTQHLGGASSALAVEALYEFEEGQMHSFLRAMDLLLESEVSLTAYAPSWSQSHVRATHQADTQPHEREPQHKNRTPSFWERRRAGNM